MSVESYGLSGKADPYPLGIHPLNRQSPVHLDDLAGGIGEIAPDQHGHRFTHILWVAPSIFEGQSLCDHLVIHFPTLLVMSVFMTPGSISYTGILNSASRTAQSLVAIVTPALEMQYSPRFGEATNADKDEMLIMQPEKLASDYFCRIILLATVWVRK
jgi:hypothetical protein